MLGDRRIGARHQSVKCIFQALAISLLLVGQVCAQKVRNFDIPSQDAAAALREFGRQTGLQVLFPFDAAAGRVAPAIQGSFTDEEVLTRLVAAAGLRVVSNDRNTVALGLVATSGGTSAPSAGPAGGTREVQSAHSEMEAPDESGGGGRGKPEPVQATVADMDTLLVTGTRIRGVQDLAAPVTVIGREELLQSGAMRTEDVFRFLPQNFDSHNSEASRGLGNVAASNVTGYTGNSIDLRGLGPASTLILVDGRRRAARSVININSLPLSMFEKIEIVTGGRSAMYGSDAVGGVVNFVTRRDFSGVEAGIDYGDTSNGQPRQQGNVLVGSNGASGGWVAGYSYANELQFNGVDTGMLANPDFSQTRYTNYPLRPDRTQHGINLSTHKRLEGVGELFFEGIYNLAEDDVHLDRRTLNALQDSTQHTDSDTRSLDLTVGWRKELGTWQLSTEAHMAMSRGRSIVDSVTAAASSVSTSMSDAYGVNREDIGSVIVEGPLPLIGGLQPRLAAGGEFRRQQSRQTLQTVSNGVVRDPTRSDLQRVVRAGFVELQVPLVEDGRRSYLRRLELSLAGRFEKYSDFGNAFSPQAGLVWGVGKTTRLRASYSRAFKAPAITFLAGSMGTPVLRNLADPLAPGGVSPVFYSLGTVPVLQPERAHTWSAGADWMPKWLDGGKFSLDLFEINYQDRIALPASGSDLLLLLQREDLFGELIDRSPTAAELDAYLALNPRPISSSTGTPIVGDISGASILQAFPGVIMFDGMQRNLSVEYVRGIDFGLRAYRTIGLGELTFGLNGTHLLNHHVRLSPGSVAISRLNEVGKPVDLRLRGNMLWQRGRWMASGYLNHVGNYVNPFADPSGRMSSWTILDLTVGYEGSVRTGSVGWRLLLSGRNVFDRPPPRLYGDLVSGQLHLYDPTNANAEGRAISMRLILEMK